MTPPTRLPKGWTQHQSKTTDKVFYAHKEWNMKVTRLTDVFRIEDEKRKESMTSTTSTLSTTTTKDKEDTIGKTTATPSPEGNEDNNEKNNDGSKSNNSKESMTSTTSTLSTTTTKDKEDTIGKTTATPSPEGNGDNKEKNNDGSKSNNSSIIVNVQDVKDILAQLLANQIKRSVRVTTMTKSGFL